MRFPLALLLTCSLLAPLSIAQTEEPPAAPDETALEAPVEPIVSLEERSLATLEALRDSREAKRAALKTLRDNFDPNVDSEQRLQQLAQARELQLEINKLEYDFESVATGIDVRAFDLGVEEEFDFIGEVEGLLQPIVSELRKATETPREIERLRGAVEYTEEHVLLAKAAESKLLELIASIGEEPEEPELKLSLEASLASWRERIKGLDNQRTVAEFQLEQRLGRQKPVFDSAQAALATFFRTRGLNLLIAALTFFAILIGLRAAYRVASRLLRRKGGGERKFYARVIDVFYFGFSGLAALSGALLVLYSAGDWAVLGVAILLLLGLAWASKTAIPIFFEQIRLLLNLGTVREGERVTYNGLPWKVSRLSVSVTLVNGELSGGQLRVPLRDMTELRSRIHTKNERWFPTSQEDWILIDGSRLARVSHQSPEMVRVQLQGGSTITYPTIDFLSICIENLSAGFRIRQRFGIDYAHQATCTDEVPRRMREHLIEKLHALLEPELLAKLQVEFLEAAASSLDYAILADFKADAAPRRNELDRALQRFAVEACNAEGWGIPFTQVTLHQAPAG